MLIRQIIYQLLLNITKSSDLSKKNSSNLDNWLLNIMVKKTIILKLWTKECTFQYVELRHIRINTEIIILFSSLFLSTILCNFFQFNSYYESQVFDIRVIYVINELFPVNMTIVVINNICLSCWKNTIFSTISYYTHRM